MYIVSSVMSIGYGAFCGCKNLTNVIIGNGVELIDELAFALCEKLTSLTIGNSVKIIEKTAFINCDLSSLIIPDSVTTIKEAAFVCKVLKYVVLGSGITTIGANAITNSTSPFPTFYYKGSAEDWDKVEGYLGTIFYYSDIKPTEYGNYWHYDQNGEIAVWQ